MRKLSMSRESNRSPVTAKGVMLKAHGVTVGTEGGRSLAGEVEHEAVMEGALTTKAISNVFNARSLGT